MLVYFDVGKLWFQFNQKKSRQKETSLLPDIKTYIRPLNIYCHTRAYHGNWDFVFSSRSCKWLYANKPDLQVSTFEKRCCYWCDIVSLSLIYTKLALINWKSAEICASHMNTASGFLYICIHKYIFILCYSN